jgi:hypothetical protein
MMAPENLLAHQRLSDNVVGKAWQRNRYNLHLCAAAFPNPIENLSKGTRLS